MTDFRLCLLLFTLLVSSLGRASSPDSSQCEALNEKGWALRNNKPDSAIWYFNEALNLSAFIRHQDQMAVAYHHLGEVYASINQLKYAEENYLNWRSIRCEQGDRQCRWAVKKLIFFYLDLNTTDRMLEETSEWLRLSRKEDASNVYADSKWLVYLYGYHLKSYALTRSLVDSIFKQPQGIWALQEAHETLAELCMRSADAGSLSRLFTTWFERYEQLTSLEEGKLLNSGEHFQNLATTLFFTDPDLFQAIQSNLDAFILKHDGVTELMALYMKIVGQVDMEPANEIRTALLLLQNPNLPLTDKMIGEQTEILREAINSAPKRKSKPDRIVYARDDMARAIRYSENRELTKLCKKGLKKLKVD